MDFDFGPRITNCSNHRFLSVHSDNGRIEALGFEPEKPRQGCFIGFFCCVEGIQDGIVSGLHHDNEAIVFMEISAIQKNVFNICEDKVSGRWLIEPEVFDLFDFESAVTGKLREPSDRVAFFDPELKPGKLVTLFNINSFPSESF